MKFLLTLTLVMLCINSFVFAENQPSKEHHHPVPVVSKEFQQMKALVGKWRGVKLGNKEEAVEVDYHLTSGGSALVETLFPGGPEEMVSVYHDSGKTLAMTHYCMLGNQPNMELKSSSEHAMEFDFVKSPGINEAVDPHMHALTVTLADNDHMLQSWKFYSKGSEQEVTKFKLERVR